MADNLTGIGEITESNRTDWSPAGNGGLSHQTGLRRRQVAS